MDQPQPAQITLRPTSLEDVAVLHAHQCDRVARRMAAFTGAEPVDRAASESRWSRLLADDSITARTVLQDGRIAGHVMCYVQEGHLEVTYWIGQDFWGRGVATAALRALLAEVRTRPMYARVAADNIASRRVLEKCGFQVIETTRGYAAARDAEIDEHVLRLDLIEA